MTFLGSFLCFTFVSVCLRATEDTFWPRNLIFGLKGPWDMRKKHIFFVFFEILKKDIFRVIFVVFTLSYLIISVFARGHIIG